MGQIALTIPEGKIKLNLILIKEIVLRLKDSVIAIN